MHDPSDSSDQKPDHNASGDRKVRAVSFGLGVAALAGLVATTGAAAPKANTAADNPQPAAITAPAAHIFAWWHLTCSGQD